MARILVATYMVRYPLGGMLSWALQYALGFHRLGHEVYLLERATYPHACFDPQRNLMTDEGSCGYRLAEAALSSVGLADRLVFEGVSGELLGGTRAEVARRFATADVLVDIGNHGAWLAEADEAGLPSVLIDGEPGFTQMKMVGSGAPPPGSPGFTHYFTNGANVGTSRSSAPNAGRRWHHVFNPVDTQLYRKLPAAPGGRVTTVMNWQSHEPLCFAGARFGQKDVEFARFVDLPRRVGVELEVAAAGRVPRDELVSHGWHVTDPHRAARSLDDFRRYIAGSMAEFSVAKNVFVATRSGWFSDRSAAYLASGRPVVLQDTGFSAHLPCGEGLFAVGDVAQAAEALEAIAGRYRHHADCARQLAEEHLDAARLMARVLDEVAG